VADRDLLAGGVPHPLGVDEDAVQVEDDGGDAQRPVIIGEGGIWVCPRMSVISIPSSSS
jgi:hypothetical protein